MCQKCKRIHINIYIYINAQIHLSQPPATPCEYRLHVYRLSVSPSPKASLVPSQYRLQLSRHGHASAPYDNRELGGNKTKTKNIFAHGRYSWRLFPIFKNLSKMNISLGGGRKNSDLDLRLIFYEFSKQASTSAQCGLPIFTATCSSSSAFLIKESPPLPLSTQPPSSTLRVFFVFVLCHDNLAIHPVHLAAPAAAIVCYTVFILLATTSCPKVSCLEQVVRPVTQTPWPVGVRIAHLLRYRNLHRC